MQHRNPRQRLGSQAQAQAEPHIKGRAEGGGGGGGDRKREEVRPILLGAHQQSGVRGEKRHVQPRPDRRVGGIGGGIGGGVVGGVGGPGRGPGRGPLGPVLDAETAVEGGGAGEGLGLRLRRLLGEGGARVKEQLDVDVEGAQGRIAIVQPDPQHRLSAAAGRQAAPLCRGRRPLCQGRRLLLRGRQVQHLIGHRDVAADREAAQGDGWRARRRAASHAAATLGLGLEGGGGAGARTGRLKLGAESRVKLQVDQRRTRACRGGDGVDGGEHALDDRGRVGRGLLGGYGHRVEVGRGAAGERAARPSRWGVARPKVASEVGDVPHG